MMRALSAGLVRWLPWLWVVLTGCAVYPAPGDDCSDAGELSCGSISTNDRLILHCISGRYQPVTTCPQGSCVGSQTGDHLFCDRIPYAVQGAACTGKQGFACAAGERAVLRCGAIDWVVDQRCAQETSCGRGADGGYACL